MTDGPSGPPVARGARWRRGLTERVLLLGPGFAYILVLFLIPLGLIISLAFFQRGRFGGVVYEPTLANFERALQPVYVQVLIDSVVIAGITTCLALLIGYAEELRQIDAPQIESIHEELVSVVPE